MEDASSGLSSTVAAGAVFIRACPFCGAQGFPQKSREGYHVRCVLGCNAIGPTEDAPFAAIERWNDRALPVNDVVQTGPG